MTFQCPLKVGPNRHKGAIVLLGRDWTPVATVSYSLLVETRRYRRMAQLDLRSGDRFYELGFRLASLQGASGIEIRLRSEMRRM